MFRHILGDFAEVSAHGIIRIHEATIVDPETKQSTGKVIPKNVHDQLAVSGTLQGQGNEPNTFVNLHLRTGLPLTGEHGKGRTALKWIIDGEFGTIEVQNRPEDGGWGAFLTTTENRVFLNGEELKVASVESDRLGASGKAWLEFAKGKDGVYYDLEKSVKVHQVLDAALTSIQDGRRISLV